MSDSCRFDFLQIEGDDGGAKYCGRSEKEVEFRSRGSVAMDMNSELHKDLDSYKPNTGFVIKIVNTTGQGEFLSRYSLGAIHLGHPAKIWIFRPPSPVSLGLTIEFL